MLFNPDPTKPSNNIDHTIKPLNNKDNSRLTILSSSRYIYSYSLLSDSKNSLLNTSDIIYGDTKNIRLTLTPQAIRNSKYNRYIGKFDTGYPENDNYDLCNQRLSLVFNYSNAFYTSFFNNQLTYPSNNTIGLVKDLKLTNNSCGANTCVIDNISGLCTTPPRCINQSQIIPLPPNLKNTIKGYAFYLQTFREVEIPNIGNRMVACAGGHVCCRTDFIPRIITPNGMYSGNGFDMNNHLPCPTQSNPVPNFIPIDQYERSAFFTIEIPDINDVINNSLFLLICNSDGGCHNGVTMIFLVAEDAVTNESYLIFASCVGVGCTDPIPMGTIIDTSESPEDCEQDPDPAAKCDELKVKFEGCSFPLSGPWADNPNSLALANYINSILSTISTIEVNFDINGNYTNQQVSGSSIVGNYGTVYYTITITRSLSSTSISIIVSSANVINGTTAIFSAGINVSNSPANPYDTVEDTTSDFAGWFAGAINGCELNMILNPII
jgi:hypothetical protein